VHGFIARAAQARHEARVRLAVRLTDALDSLAV
jgi:hypothetical protein